MRNGQEIFQHLLAAMAEARVSICLEVYIYSPDAVGAQVRATLLQACRRGVRVRVLYDALGSMSLSGAFWAGVREAGGEVRAFNPLRLYRLGIRDHRKLLICDEQVAFVGGFNIAAQYAGDGVTSGWYDIGLMLQGPLVQQLTVAFDEMFERADFRAKGFKRLRKPVFRERPARSTESLLLSGPGWRRSPITRALRKNLAHAREVQMMMAYFLPTWRIRQDLTRIVRRGGRVQLLLAGKSDVLVSQLAGQSLYRRFLRAGVEVHEYQPQILHAKLVVIDQVVYVGSANLDPRSLNINYELMLRLENEALAGQARETFSAALKHCRQITLAEWSQSRTLWRRIKQHWAYLLLVRLDPHIARYQWRGLGE